MYLFCHERPPGSLGLNDFQARDVQCWLRYSIFRPGQSDLVVAEKSEKSGCGRSSQHHTSPALVSRRSKSSGPAYICLRWLREIWIAPGKNNPIELTPGGLLVGPKNSGFRQLPARLAGSAVRIRIWL